MKLFTTIAVLLAPILGLSSRDSPRSADHIESEYQVDCAQWTPDCNGVGQFANDNETLYGHLCTTTCVSDGNLNSTCGGCRDYRKCQCSLSWFDAPHDAAAQREAAPLLLIKDALGAGFNDKADYRYQILDGEIKGLQVLRGGGEK